MIIPLVLLSAALASAQVGAPNVATLKESFLSATTDAERTKALDLLTKTAPTSAQDVSALFDLFSRFPNKELRGKVMASLALIPPDSPQLEPLFIDYLKQPEPAAKIFGINGAFRLRAPKALPILRKMAERKLGAAHPDAVSVLAQRNAWWVEYEALSALAQWEGPKSYKLVLRRSEESPEVARLLGSYYWERALPLIGKWSKSTDPGERERAAEAAQAPIPEDEARATRARMLALVRDPGVARETRHRLALKIGASSTAAEVRELIKTHDAAPPADRLIWAAAVFASRRPEAVPLLLRYAQEGADPIDRRGARAQLEEMLGRDKADALISGANGDKKDDKK
jgi:hypothetical protein